MGACYIVSIKDQKETKKKQPFDVFCEWIDLEPNNRKENEMFGQEYNFRLEQDVW